MTTLIRRAMFTVSAFVLLAVPALAQPSGGQDVFVPARDLPPAEQTPAGPLVIAAYAFFLVAVLVYVWSIWRRLGKVEADMHALEQRIVKRSSPR